MLSRRLFIRRFCMSPCSSDYIITLKVPGARGLIIVGTHSLVVRGFAAPMPAATSYGIVSERVSPFHPVLQRHQSLALEFTKSSMASRVIMLPFVQQRVLVVARLSTAATFIAEQIISSPLRGHALRFA